MKKTSSLGKAHTDAEYIFRMLLPAHGLAIRQAQIELCHEMLDAMFLGRVALCDAGTGIGKTHAYLVAGLLWKKYRPHSLPETLTLSTSSIALQEAIIEEYLPVLSQVLNTDGLLAKPIHAVVRKGRERYVCDLRLANRQAAVVDSERVSVQRKAALSMLDKQIDMDKIAGLSDYDRAKICVPADCPRGCAIQNACRYRDYLKESKSQSVDIQICNHNFLLADAMHRQQKSRPLLKDYHVLIVDEAHKLPEAARQMYGESLSVSEISELCTLLKRGYGEQRAKKLREAEAVFIQSLWQEGKEDRLFEIKAEHKTAAGMLEVQLRKAAILAKDKDLPHSMKYRLERTADSLALFGCEGTGWIKYIQKDRDGEITLHAVNRNSPEQLARDLWQTGKAAILASGTLAVGGDFLHIRQRLGLERTPRCREFTVPSPFDYKENGLLYIPTNEMRKGKAWLGKSLRELLQACHGHALVLFTSYTLMSKVDKTLKEGLPFPLLEAWRGGRRVVRQFKEMSNAVLCAAGPCWEGVDFPGDIVSLLIVVRLPFPVPTPVSEAEREQYPCLAEYIRSVIVPEMQTKLRQGVGRAIRTEKDTCVIAILDERAAPGGRYHDAVCKALPPCPITGRIQDVRQFIRARKSPGYFI